MQLQHLKYFVTLARTRHFARAANECGVTQPTLSAGLVALEQELGKRLVERDRRFVGLTEQGEAILPWAEQALGSIRSLAQAAEAATQHLTGEFRLAAIPAALPLVGPFGRTLLRGNPSLTLAVTAGTSREIVHGLRVNEFDAGLTYLDDEAPADMLTVPMHQEQYVFVARGDTGFDDRTDVSWEEVSEMRLCLLHQGMQYRRILDREFASRGLSPRPVATADSHLAMMSMVYSGDFVTIVPDAYTLLMTGLDWCKVLPFSPAAETRRIGLMAVSHDPLGNMARAALASAQDVGPNAMTTMA